MPIAIGGEVYPDELSYTAKQLGIQLPAPEEASGSSQTQGGTQVPPEENNASASQYDGQRGILDQLLGQTGERYQTWPEKAIRSSVSAMALPGDVLSGKVQPGSLQEIEKAIDLAGLMVMGPAPVASRMADGTLGSFIGVKAKTFDKNRLAQAQLMEHQGLSADEIWKQAKMFRGADGRWKAEIGDNTSKLKDTGFEFNTTKPDPSLPKGWGDEPLTTVSVKNPPVRMETLFTSSKPYNIKLSDALDHPELFKAYPELRDVSVAPLPHSLQDRGLIGMFHDNTVYLRDGLDPQFAKEVMLHELDHKIQSIEGFARGGSSAEFKSPALAKAEEQFNTVKNKTEKELMETKGWSKRDLESTKGLIRNEATLSDTYRNHLNLWKNKHPDAYNRLKDIVNSEDLLRVESEKQHDQYWRLMGEVSARNVEKRAQWDALMRSKHSPQSTESVPRDKQISKF